MEDRIQSQMDRLMKQPPKPIQVEESVGTTKNPEKIKTREAFQPTDQKNVNLEISTSCQDLIVEHVEHSQFKTRKLCTPNEHQLSKSHIPLTKGRISPSHAGGEQSKTSTIPLSKGQYIKEICKKLRSITSRNLRK